MQKIQNSTEFHKVEREKRKEKEAYLCNRERKIWEVNGGKLENDTGANKRAKSHALYIEVETKKKIYIYIYIYICMYVCMYITDFQKETKLGNSLCESLIGAFWTVQGIRVGLGIWNFRLVLRNSNG